MIYKHNTTEKDDEVSELIDGLYDELMTMRVEYMRLRRKGNKDLGDMLAIITDMNEDFDGLIKAHTLYLRFKKATGQGKATHSSEMLTKIREIRANLGSIVSQIPK